MVTAIAGAGTGEAHWLPVLAALDPPRLALAPPPRRAVVVAPHPDDEVLGVGGLLALLLAAGTRIEVVAVTDGEASHPGGSLPRNELASLRRAEQARALGVLGVHTAVRRLGLPDGGSDGLEQPLLEHLTAQPGDWLIGPWRGDGHPDHEAVGRACARVATRDGARLLAYPIWAWHWAAPDDHRVPWAAVARIALPAGILALKARAIAEFVTQIHPLDSPDDAPILPRAVLDRFTRSSELVFG